MPTFDDLPTNPEELTMLILSRNFSNRDYLDILLGVSPRIVDDWLWKNFSKFKNEIVVTRYYSAASMGRGHISYDLCGTRSCVTCSGNNRELYNAILNIGMAQGVVDEAS